MLDELYLICEKKVGNEWYSKRYNESIKWI